MSPISKAMISSIAMLENDDSKRVLLVGDIHLEGIETFSDYSKGFQAVTDEFKDTVTSLLTDKHLENIIAEFSVASINAYRELDLSQEGAVQIPFIAQFLGQLYDINSNAILSCDLIREHEDFAEVVSENFPDIIHRDIPIRDLNSTGLQLDVGYARYVQTVLEGLEKKIDKFPVAQKDAVQPLFVEYKREFLIPSIHAIFHDGPNIEALVNLLDSLYTQNKKSALIYVGNGHITKLIKLLNKAGFRTVKEMVTFPEEMTDFDEKILQNIKNCIKSGKRWICKSE
jgi:hypothetical protein